MTIREVTMYQALCDRCGNADDEGDYFAWADAEQAVDQALESEWEQIGDRLLCPSCVVWSDAEDQFVERSDEPRSAGQPVRRAAADKPPISAAANWTNEQEETT